MPAPKLDNVTPLPSSPAAAGVATVLGEHPEGGYRLDHGGHERLATRATSCLIAPAVGDRVWVVGEGGQRWILAVLERDAAARGPVSTVVDLPGDATVRAAGTLTLAGCGGMALTSPQGMDVSADELRVQARRGRAALGELSLVARTLFSSVKKVTRVGEVLELLVDRVTQRSTHSVRVIEGLDRTQAETLELRATGDAHLQATHAMINGKDLVKMDGGQIHLG